MIIRESPKESSHLVYCSHPVLRRCVYPSARKTTLLDYSDIISKSKSFQSGVIGETQKQMTQPNGLLHPRQIRCTLCGFQKHPDMYVHGRITCMYTQA
jgi:hypothetical protein